MGSGLFSEWREGISPSERYCATVGWWLHTSLGFGYIPIDFPSASATCAYGINDSGNIYAGGTRQNLSASFLC
jgi:hypothetical protein